MKILSRMLLVVGIAGILFGLASCVHFYTVNPPPEASQPNWDAEAHDEPYIAFARFICTFGGGVIAFLVGFYLYGKTRRIHSKSLV